MASLAHAEPLPPPRERPWLLPHNRRLRHVQGITIRNLALAPAPTSTSTSTATATATATPQRTRGKTFDDDAIPSTLKSPAKALALAESKSLGHSRSSTDLSKHSNRDAPRRANGSLRDASSLSAHDRPALGRGLRRRSTMEWISASPLTRQKKLQDISAGRQPDTFFALHIDNQKEPVYISEVAEKAMNPNFNFFDLSPCGPAVTRLDKLTVRVWARSETVKGWQYLIEYTAHFNTLHFIGKTLGNFRHPLPPNCILFHMTDGIYTSFMDLPVRDRAQQLTLAPPKAYPDGRVLNSSSYDALMRLSTLDDCIQDALSTRDSIAREIETILESSREAISTVEHVPEAQESLRTVQAAVAAERRRVDAVRKRRDELAANIQSRREQMQAGRDQQTEIDANLPTQQGNHVEMRGLVDKVEEDILGQRRRICEDILRIFPIEPVPGKAFSFTIRGLLLPHSDFDDVEEDVTAAALGYVAQVVNLLSPYLAVILPYPVTPLGSTSTIDDPLAMGHSNQHNPRTYPLYLKGVVRYRFEYGVFLLNKDIEILSNALGLRPVDIRHTLPNLKYLLYVATAGKGELPARKSGGIKGLLRQDSVRSRRGSVDSMATASSFGAIVGETKAKVDKAGGNKAEASKANGGPMSAVASLAHKTNALPGSRLRPVE